MTLHDLLGLAFAVFAGVSLSRLLWSRLPSSVTREPHTALQEHLTRHERAPATPTEEEIEREILAVEEQMRSHEAIAKRRHDVYRRLVAEGRIKTRPHGILGIPILAGPRIVADSEPDTEPENPKH